MVVRPLAVVGALALAAAGVGTVLNRSTPRHVRPGLNVRGNPAAPVDEDNSPALARNPRRGDNLVSAYRVDRPEFSATLAWSADGGRSWHPTALPLPEGKDRPYAPDVAFGADGTLYVLYVNLTGRGNGPDALWLSTSVDGGRTLAPPTRVAGALAFQPRLAIDRRGPVYATWLQAADTGILRFSGSPEPFVVAARSTDGGRTFSAPVRVSDPARPRVGAASAVVDPKGRLVVLYEDFKDDVRDFGFLEGPPYEGTFALVVTVSGDGGATFSAGVEPESGVVPSRRFLVFLPDFPSLAAGPGGTLYVSWADARSGDDDVYLRRSGDGGRTWSSAVRVNDSPRPDHASQSLPHVAVAPDGRVDVLFYDRRADPGRDVFTEVTLATSSDEGRTWRNTVVSDRAFDSRVGSSADPRLPVDLGNRLGLATSDGRTWAAWADTRFGNAVDGRQDVVFAPVRQPGTVPLVGRWPLVAGLVIFGMAAVSASRSRERQEDSA